MSRNSFASSNNDAESALSDDDLEGVVGGTRGRCIHGSTTAHQYTESTESGPVTKSCSGPSGGGVIFD